MVEFRVHHFRINASEKILFNVPLGKYELWVDGQYFCTLTMEEYYELVEGLEYVE